MNPPAALPSPAPAGPARFRARIPGGRILAILFGIVLPVAALAFELGTGMSRDFFDPIPTLGHVLAVAFVPLAHLLSLLALRGSAGARPRIAPGAVARLNSAALAIGLAYAVCYAPITPFAFIAIVFAGLGLLPLAPLASLVAALTLRTGLRRQAAAAGTRLPSLWPGFAAGLLFLAALEARAVFTLRGVHQIAHAGSPAAEAAAVQRLRLFGSEEHLLRGSYEACIDTPRRWLLDLVAESATPAACQLAYYRVTGRPYNSVPAPRSSHYFRERGETDEWVWDASLGDQQVGQRVRALHLTESRLDARLEGDPALGYLEWTLVFRNDHRFQQREARALVQLPPGAVVSRLTLWIHGEEREAAFAGRAQVIQAYKSVVSQRRDPVLVIAQGPDRVLVQCFPVEPNGGLMKIRLGITTPLPLANLDEAHLLLPRLIEQNFSVPSTFRHHLWVDADAPLATSLPGLSGASAAPDRFTLRGVLSPAELAAPRAVLTVARGPGSEAAWAHAAGEPGWVVTQVLGRQAPAAGPIVLALSGSAELAPAAAALATALEASGPATPFASLFVAGDVPAASPAGLDAFAQARWLRAQNFTGGQDDTAALSDAVGQLAENGAASGTLVWLHGGQPLAWQNPEALEQRLAHRTARLRVLAVSAVSGPHLLLEKLAAGAPLATYPRLAGLPEDLARLLRELRDGAVGATRSIRLAGSAAPAGRKASGQLARLWASDEVKRLLATGSPADREEALRLAVRSRIVTPVSGAVVLETQAQYDAAGLSPSGPPDAPDVPEPAVCGLVAAGAALAFVLLRRPRRPARPAPACA